MTRRTAREERQQEVFAELLRQSLASLRASQRSAGRTLPPVPSGEDYARYASTPPAERERVATLLCRAGYTPAEVDRGEAMLRARQVVDNVTLQGEPADDLTRMRARALARGRR